MRGGGNASAPVTPRGISVLSKGTPWALAELAASWARPPPPTGARLAACAEAMGAPRDTAAAQPARATPHHAAPRRLLPPPPRRGCAVRAAAAPPSGLGIPVTAEPIRAPCWRCRAVSARRRPGRERCGGGRAALPRSPAVASPRPMGIESFCSADGHDPFWVSGGMGP